MTQIVVLGNASELTLGAHIGCEWYLGSYRPGGISGVGK